MRIPTLAHPFTEDESWVVERHGFFGWTNTAGGVSIQHTLEDAIKEASSMLHMEQDFNDRMNWPLHSIRIRNKMTGEIIPGEVLTQ